MKRLYGENVLDILPIKDGFIFAMQQAAYDDKLIVAYKAYSFNTSVVSPIKKSVYLAAKFGRYYASFEDRLMDYISCSSVLLPDNKTLVCYRDGGSFVYDEAGHELWSGNISYKGEGPACVIMNEDKLWCSFSNGCFISRFNARTIKEEMRFGGLEGTFIRPEKIFILDSRLYICCSGTKKIYTIDIGSFDFEEYAEFDESVYQYIKINSNELVLLDTGIYRM